MTNKSNILEMLHDNASDLHEVGIIPKKTMRSFDKLCLTPIKPLAPEEIRQIREREAFSQSVFAHYLNVSKNLVSDWERGIKKPSGAALKLLTIVQNKGIIAIL